MTGCSALPPQVRTLVACGRAALDGTRVRVPQDVPIDRPRDIVEYALRHGMVTWLPKTIGAQAKRAHAARALTGIRTLIDVAAGFSSAGVAAVWLKGPVLSAWLYGDPAARQFADIDVLVRPQDRDHAADTLGQHGYRRVIPGRAGAIIFASLGAWPFECGDDIRVDLHWRAAARRFPEVVTPEDAVHEAVTICIAGRHIATPRPAHTAALVLAHAAKHLWYALELPLSIGMLTQRRDVDWDDVHRLSARAGALRAASAGLRLASELFDTPIPTPFGSAVQDPDAMDLCRCAHIALALPPNIFPDRTLERRIHRLAFDTWPARFAYDVRRLVEPTRAEWEWVKLPDAVAPLYVPVRPLRLLLAKAGLLRRQ